MGRRPAGLRLRVQGPPLADSPEPCTVIDTTAANQGGWPTVSVDLLLTESGGVRTPVGWIDFYVLPSRKDSDAVCTPPSIVSFAEAQAISIELSQDVAQGRVGRYEWRKSRWWQSGLFRWLRRPAAHIKARWHRL